MVNIECKLKLKSTYSNFGRLALRLGKSTLTGYPYAIRVMTLKGSDLKVIRL